MRVYYWGLFKYKEGKHQGPPQDGIPCHVCKIIRCDHYRGPHEVSKSLNITIATTKSRPIYSQFNPKCLIEGKPCLDFRHEKHLLQSPVSFTRCLPFNKITRQTKRQEKAAPQEIIRIDPEEMRALRALTDVWASKDVPDARLAEGYQKELQLSGPNKNSGTEKSTFQNLSNRAHKKRRRRGKGREWRKEEEEGEEAEEEG